MRDEDGEERRRHRRYPLRVPVTAARGSEEPCAPGHSIDISLEGVLICIPPVAPPARPGDRVLMSFCLPDGALHLIGTACRCARGADGNWYVAVEYSLVDPADRERLRAICEARWPDASPEPGSGEAEGACESSRAPGGPLLLAGAEPG